jgi:hypothetical protein
MEKGIHIIGILGIMSIRRKGDYQYHSKQKSYGRHVCCPDNPPKCLGFLNSDSDSDSFIMGPARGRTLLRGGGDVLRRCGWIYATGSDNEPANRFSCLGPCSDDISDFLTLWLQNSVNFLRNVLLCGFEQNGYVYKSFQAFISLKPLVSCVSD